MRSAGAVALAVTRRKRLSVIIFATARNLAILIYRMLRHGQNCLDEGTQAYESRFQAPFGPALPRGSWATISCLAADPHEGRAHRKAVIQQSFYFS